MACPRTPKHRIITCLDRTRDRVEIGLAGIVGDENDFKLIGLWGSLYAGIEPPNGVNGAGHLVALQPEEQRHEALVMEAICWERAVLLVLIREHCEEKLLTLSMSSVPTHWWNPGAAM